MKLSSPSQSFASLDVILLFCSLKTIYCTSTDATSETALLQLSLVKMRGFMCQSAEVTSGCTLPETRNVIVPRRVLSLTKNGGLSTRLIEQEKARFDGRKEADASRRSGSLIVKPSGDKRSGQGYVNSSSDIMPSMAPPTAYSSKNAFQVVVMRASLHCQGCAGKVKKHPSRVEGVTSFSIDLEEKRVTVRGHVSPKGVLESISKIRGLAIEI